MLPGITSDLQARRIALIHKRLAAAQNSDSLSNCERFIKDMQLRPDAHLRMFPVIRYIVGDADKTLRSWGASGSIDPFSHIPAVRSFSGSHAPLAWFLRDVNLLLSVVPPFHRSSSKRRYGAWLVTKSPMTLQRWRVSGTCTIRLTSPRRRPACYFLGCRAPAC